MNMLEDIKTLNEKLYHWATVELNDPNNTNPYLIIPDERYQNASFRILVLGKETNGWGEGKDENCHSAKDLEKLYFDKIINKEIGRSSPFWDFYFSYILENLKKRSDIGVCVSNVVLLGYKNGNTGYNPEYASKLKKYQKDYIKILNPNAIICFTGFGSDKDKPPYAPYLEILEHLWGTYSRDKDRVLGKTNATMRKLSFADSKGIDVYGTNHPGWVPTQERDGINRDEWKQSIVNSILNDIIPKPQAEAKADGSADEQ